MSKPKISATPTTPTPLYKEKRKLGVTPLKRIPRLSLFPASSFQKSLVLSHLTYNQNVSLNTITMHEIVECFHHDIFCKVVDEVIKRHEIFRTFFKVSDNEVFQVVIPPSDFNLQLTVTDLSHLEPENQKIELERVAIKIGYAPLDLIKEPPLRIRLFKTAPSELVLLRVAHHAIIDVSTHHIFCKEVSDLYEARINGKTAHLPEPEFHFADYAVWEKDNLTDHSLKKQFDFWKETFAGGPDMIQFPLDFERPKEIGQNFKMETMVVSPESWGLSKRLAKEFLASEFQVNMALLFIFLYRFTGEDDISIGSTVDLRRARGLPNLAGPLVNEFLVRCQLHPNMSFIETMREILSRSRRAYLNIDLPYEKIIEAANGKRESTSFLYYSGNPIYDNNPLGFNQIFLDAGGGEWDLVYQMTDHGDTANITVRYNADLFLPTSIQQMLEKFCSLYSVIVKNPKIKLGQLPSLTPQVKKRAA